MGRRAGVMAPDPPLGAAPRPAPGARLSHRRSSPARRPRAVPPAGVARSAQAVLAALTLPFTKPTGATIGKPHRLRIPAQHLRADRAPAADAQGRPLYVS